ncbi:MAG: VWA domain-containing protein [bacterium]|nr:VWA domain-containing protein [bacterium]
MNPIDEISAQPESQPAPGSLYDEHLQRDYLFKRDIHSLEMTVALFNSFILHQSTGETFLLVELLSREKPRAGRESPLNLVLLLDKSHSMFAGPILEVIKAAKVVIDQLTGRDSLTVIAFDHEAKVVLSSKRVLNKEEAKRRLDSIDVTGGSTDLHAALKLGFHELRELAGENSIDKIVLLTDGRPTHGETLDQSFFQLAENVREKGASVSAVGVGLDYNEDLLSSIARLSGGGFYHSPRPREIKKIFKKEIAHFLNVSHRNIELSITPRKWVKIREIFGLPHRFESGNYIVQLPDLEKYTEQTVLLTLQYENHPAGLFRMVDVKTKYYHVSTGVESEISGWAAARFVDDPTIIKRGKNPRVDKALLRRNVKSDLISTIRGIRTRVLSREDAQHQLKDYQRTLILSGNTKEARELGEAIQQLAVGQDEAASKTLTQSTFSLERGKRETIAENDDPDESDTAGDDE